MHSGIGSQPDRWHSHPARRGALGQVSGMPSIDDIAAE